MMGLKERISALFGPHKKNVVDELRDGETMIVQRRNGRLVYRKVQVFTDRDSEVLVQKRRRRLKTRADFGAIRIVRLPRPEELIFKVSSGL